MISDAAALQKQEVPAEPSHLNQRSNVGLLTKMRVELKGVHRVTKRLADAASVPIIMLGVAVRAFKQISVTKTRSSLSFNVTNAFKPHQMTSGPYRI